MRRLEIDQIQRNVSGLPSLGEKEITDIVRFSVKDGQLLMDVPLAPTDQSNVTIRGRQWYSQVSLLQHLHFRTMSFVARDFTTAGAVEVQTEILTGPMNNQIAQDTELSGETRSVSLIEQLQKQQPVGVTLRVQDIIDATGKDVAHVRITAASFEELRRENPRETDAYLRPIFRVLGQEPDVFLIDRATAWQVLSEPGAVDPTVAGPVMEIVRRLDADSFDDREAAMNRLEQIGEPAALVLERADRASWSDQQQSMVDAFLVRHRPLSDADTARYRSDNEFLLDCLYNSDPRIRTMALKRLQTVSGRTITIDLSADAAKRRAEIESWRDRLVNAGLPATQPAELIDSTR